MSIYRATVGSCGGGGSHERGTPVGTCIHQVVEVVFAPPPGRETLVTRVPFSLETPTPLGSPHGPTLRPTVGF